MNKKYFVYVLGFICIWLCACGGLKNNPDDEGDTIEIENSSSEIEEVSDLKSLHIQYEQSDIEDCVSWNEEVLKRWLAYAEKINEEAAVCVVTVTDLGVEDIKEESGTVLLKIKIDSILEKSEQCLLMEDEVITASDFSRWRREAGKYIVSYAEGSIPIAQKEAQYVVLLYSQIEDEEMKYKIEGVSIPITDEISKVSYIVGCYDEMELPEDVQRFSEELISKAFGQKLLPSSDEIKEYIKQKLNN